jgi:hypothetical protein
MGVGQPHPVEHALDAAILAEAAVQGVEHRIRPGGGQGADGGGQVLRHLDGRHVEAGLAQGGDDLPPGGQADLALGRDAAVEDRDVHAPLP